MAITLFEVETYELTQQEIEVYIPMLIKSINKCIGKNKAVSSGFIVSAFEKKNINTNDIRIRKFINYMRANNLTELPILANNKGYYLSNDPVEIKKYIESIQQRIDAIEKVKKSLIKQLNIVENKNNLI